VQAEEDERDDQQRGAQERNDELRVDLRWQATDGSDERVFAAAQGPPPFADRSSSSVRYRSFGHVLRGAAWETTPRYW
jgi:hypothetical protein